MFTFRGNSLGLISREIYDVYLAKIWVDDVSRLTVPAYFQGSCALLSFVSLRAANKIRLLVIALYAPKRAAGIETYFSDLRFTRCMYDYVPPRQDSGGIAKGFRPTAWIYAFSP